MKAAVSAAGRGWPPTCNVRFGGDSHSLVDSDLDPYGVIGDPTTGPGAGQGARFEPMVIGWATRLAEVGASVPGR